MKYVCTAKSDSQLLLQMIPETAPEVTFGENFDDANNEHQKTINKNVTNGLKYWNSNAKLIDFDWIEFPDLALCKYELKN